MIDLPAALRMYLVADPDHVQGDFLTAVEASLRGGVTCVQLRAKHLTDREIFQLATKLRAACNQYGAMLLVNDRLDIALAAEADGVHLGVDDLPLEAARQISGENFVIGYSPETDDQLASVKSRGADYLGIGPVFSTRTKSDAGDALGLDEFHRRVQLGGLPAVGIGGITVDNAASLFDSGADGIAVVSAILGTEDPEKAALQLSRNSNSSSTRGSSAGSQ